VVCGKNALRSLGVANATTGRITALDTAQRTITLQLEDGKQVTLTRAYLEERPRWWTRGNPDRRTLDLGYATTGHRSQGRTLDRVLVRVAGGEDHPWLYVAATRGAKQTTFFDVVGPEPRPVELELDVPRSSRTASMRGSPLSGAATAASGWRSTPRRPRRLPCAR
jgi:ATP-dependent exoDNAse (exonuclease V) alpha subunit